MEKISVIVPVYNPPPARFRLCLKSLASQLGVNYEVIIVDDGSTNNVEEIVESYQSQFQNLLFSHIENQGVASARNKGMAMASGDYIVFCDADDFVENNYLISLLNGLEDADLAICGVTEQFFPVADSFVDSRVFFSFPSQYNKVQYVNFSVNKIFKKEILDQYGIHFDTSVALGEDALFIGEYLKHCHYIRSIGTPLYHYLPNPCSAVHTYFPKYWQWEKQVIETQFSQFTQYPLNDIELHYMYYWAFVKIRGAVNYYAVHEKNLDDLKKKYLREIEKSEIYSFLMKANDVKDNLFFNKKERALLNIWKKMGTYHGINMKKSALLLKKLF